MPLCPVTSTLVLHLSMATTPDTSHWFYSWAMPNRPNTFHVYNWAMPQHPDTFMVVLKLSNATTPRYFYGCSQAEQCLDAPILLQYDGSLAEQCLDALKLLQWFTSWPMPRYFYGCSLTEKCHATKILPHWFYSWALPRRPDTYILFSTVEQCHNTTSTCLIYCIL